MRHLAPLWLDPHGSDQAEPVERKRWLGERLHRQTDEQQRVVVAGRSVALQLAASITAMDEHPFTILPYGDGDGFHGRLTVGCPVARLVVDVLAPETARAMVAVGRAGGVSRDVDSAMAAPEGLRWFQRKFSRVART